MKMKSRQILLVGFIIGLLPFAAPAFEGDVFQDLEPKEGARSSAAPATDNLDDEDDEDDEDEDYQEQVRNMQAWLRRREAERRGEIPEAGDGQTQDVGSMAITAPRSTSRPSHYFDEAHGYDERGYLRLSDKLRVKLRGVDEQTDESGASEVRHRHAHRGSHHWTRHATRHGRRHESKHSHYRQSGHAGKHHDKSAASSKGSHRSVSSKHTTAKASLKGKNDPHVSLKAGKKSASTDSHKKAETKHQARK